MTLPITLPVWIYRYRYKTPKSQIRLPVLWQGMSRAQCVSSNDRLCDSVWENSVHYYPNPMRWPLLQGRAGPMAAYVLVWT